MSSEVLVEGPLHDPPPLPPVVDRWFAHYAYISKSLNRPLWRSTSLYPAADEATRAAMTDNELVPGSIWVQEIQR